MFKVADPGAAELLHTGGSTSSEVRGRKTESHQVPQPRVFVQNYYLFLRMYFSNRCSTHIQIAVSIGSFFFCDDDYLGWIPQKLTLRYGFQASI